MSTETKKSASETDEQKLAKLAQARQDAYEDRLVASARLEGWIEADLFLRREAGDFFATGNEVMARQTRDAADRLKQGQRSLILAEGEALRASAKAEEAHIGMKHAMEARDDSE